MVDYSSFDVLWGIVTSLLLSLLKKYVDVPIWMLKAFNYIFAGLGSFVYNMMCGANWHQAAVSGLVSLFSSLGWYKTAATPLRDNLNLMKKENPPNESV